MSGILSGLKVIEFDGAVPVTFTGMMLADMGADILCIERAGPDSMEALVSYEYNFLKRGRRRIAMDLKNSSSTELLQQLIPDCDVVIEGYRPGVMEKLDLGPAHLQDKHPGLIYARLSGWGQTGEWHNKAGHDLNFLSMTGILNAIGIEGSPPVHPLNLIGDFGGGSMLLLTGILAALYERTKTNKGQVIDAAMLDGSALLATLFYGLVQAGSWKPDRGTNFCDGGSHYYGTYETSDGKYMAVAPMENQFYQRFLTLMEISDPLFQQQHNPEIWPTLKLHLQQQFLTCTQQAWSDIFDKEDVCVTPVLSFDEVATHPVSISRNLFTNVDTHQHPAPAPRFSNSLVSAGKISRQVTDHRDILKEVSDWQSA